VSYLRFLSGQVIQTEHFGSDWRTPSDAHADAWIQE